MKLINQNKEIKKKKKRKQTKEVYIKIVMISLLASFHSFPSAVFYFSNFLNLMIDKLGALANNTT